MPKKWIQVIHEAVKKIENNEVELGIQVLQKVQEHGKELPEVMLYLADIWYQLGHFNQAAEILRDIHTSTLNLPAELRQDAGLLLAEIYLEEGDFEQAQTLLYQMKEEGSQDVQLYLLLADLYAVQDLEEVAVKYLQTAFDMAPENDDIRAALGEMYSRLGEMDRTVELLNDSEEHALSTLLLRGRMMAQQGEFEQAYEAYKHAFSIEQSPEVMFGCGLMAFYVGDLSEAKRFIEMLLTVDEEYVTAYPVLSDIYLSSGETEPAIEALKKYVELSGFDLDQIRRLVALLTQSGRYEEAKEYQTLLQQWDTEEEEEDSNQ
ncbi:tetratricopeptide repeat protein [Brevibacillus ginsengisoli]|uniref:tetratricopeptide repeat protein n=1 Tax=Brevibacillus ginsengisoli TaxID=363854 RepID=UPI003CE85F59